MISYYISMAVMVMGLATLAILAFKLKLSSKQGFWLSVLGLATLGLTLYVNPDFYNWYQFEKNQQAFAQAQALLKQPNQLARLKKSLQMQVKQHPEDARAWFLLGRMYASDAEWASAHDAAFQAYRLEPDNIKTAIFYVETIWQTQGKITPQARHILNTILKKDDNQPDALIMLASDANSRGCYQSAIGYWQRILVMLPKDSEMSTAITQAITQAQSKQEDCH